MKQSQKRKTTVGLVDAGVLAYTAGRDAVLDLALAEADCIGSAAHVTMLSRMAFKPRLFTEAQRKQIIAELVDIIRAVRAGRFQITLDDQDVHLAVERRLTEKLGDLGKRIHTGRSRNDQVALDLRLFSKEALLNLMTAMATVAGHLAEFAERHATVPMVGRTHMQPAMPSSVGLWASAFAESLLDDLALAIGAYEMNDQCPLGSAASYGVPLPIDRELTSDLLGFARPVHNVLYANNARGKIESVILHALSQAMLTLSRLAQDLILFSMPEFGYFKLPDEFCTGSSIMPQKKNPDVLELVRAKTARVLAHAQSIMEIMRAAPSGYNRDLQETKEPFLEGIATTLATLQVMAPLVEHLEINHQALVRGFTPDVFATDWALELVAQGQPFRDAYHYVKANLGQLAKVDPHEAIARKTHLGATAGLDFKAFAARLREARSFLREERQEFEGAISRLLGMRYPLAPARS